MKVAATVANLVDIASVTDHYKFFQNSECEYFPCHSHSDLKNFNCMFCYCPLYNRTDCGGNYSILSNGLKDCSSCLLPHTNYDYIVEKLKLKGNQCNAKNTD